jgi:hypothetical protein
MRCAGSTRRSSALRHAPFYLARKGLFLMQVGEDDAAAALIESACRSSPDNAFDSDLVIALHIVRGDRSELVRIADGHTDRSYLPSQRAQAHLAVGNLDAARALYELQAPDPRHAIDDAINDNWVWRLPHIVNHAHLRVVAGRGKRAVRPRATARAARRCPVTRHREHGPLVLGR